MLKVLVENSILNQPTGFRFPTSLILLRVTCSFYETSRFGGADIPFINKSNGLHFLERKLNLPFELYGLYRRFLIQHIHLFT